MPSPAVTLRRRVTDKPAGTGIADARPRNDVAFRDAVYRRLLAVADLCGVAAAIAAIGLTVAPRYVTASTIVAFPLIVLLAKTMGLYHRDELVLHKTTLNEAPKLFHLAALVTLAIVALKTAVDDIAFTFPPLFVFFCALLVGTLDRARDRSQNRPVGHARRALRARGRHPARKPYQAHARVPALAERRAGGHDRVRSSHRPWRGRGRVR